jgi:hypothetical protein
MMTNHMGTPQLAPSTSAETDSGTLYLLASSHNISSNFEMSIVSRAKQHQVELACMDEDPKSSQGAVIRPGASESCQLFFCMDRIIDLAAL